MNEIILEKLRGKGLRITELKKKLLDVFERAESPLSVPELTKLLSKRRLKPHKTTLYRELQNLTLAEIVEEVQLGENIQSFELKRENDHHHHFICQKCDEVIDFKNSGLEKSIARINTGLRKKGHKPSEHHLNLYGLCATCQK